MADEMTPGEIRRTLERIERSQHEAQRAVDDRITKIATDMVPASLWKAEHKALADDVRDLADDCRDASERAEKTSLERMATLRGEIATVRDSVAGVRKAQEQHVKAHEADRSWTRSKKLTVLAIAVGAAATLAGAWIAAVLAAKGVG